MRSLALAAQLVEVLCEVPLDEWRQAALAVAGDPAAPGASAALDRVLQRADRARLWDLYDDLETALFRLTTGEAIGIPGGHDARERMHDTARRAVEALVCGGALGAEHVAALTLPFLRLIPSHGAGLPDDGMRGGGR